MGNRFGSTGKDSFQDWNDESKKYVFVKAISNDKIVGCGAIRPISIETAEIKRMYSKHKGIGIGKAVLEYLELKAKELDYKQVWLETRKLNFEACKFYQKSGYDVIENYGKYIGNEDAVCFGKEI